MWLAKLAKNLLRKTTHRFTNIFAPRKMDGSPLGTHDLFQHGSPASTFGTRFPPPNGLLASARAKPWWSIRFWELWNVWKRHEIDSLNIPPWVNNVKLVGFVRWEGHRSWIFTPWIRRLNIKQPRRNWKMQVTCWCPGQVRVDVWIPS